MPPTSIRISNRAMSDICSTRSSVLKWFLKLLASIYSKTIKLNIKSDKILSYVIHYNLIETTPRSYNNFVQKNFWPLSLSGDAQKANFLFLNWIFIRNHFLFPNMRRLRSFHDDQIFPGLFFEFFPVISFRLAIGMKQNFFRFLYFETRKPR